MLIWYILEKEKGNWTDQLTEEGANLSEREIHSLPVTDPTPKLTYPANSASLQYDLKFIILGKVGSE